MAKFTVEISCKNNESVIFNPTKERLRGRLDSRNTAGRRPLPVQQEIFSRVSLIPGILVELDTDKQTGRCIDPLGETASGREILETINSVMRRNQATTGGEKKAWEPTTHKLNQDRIKEWAFHMRSLIDCECAVYVPGSQELPTCEKIATEWKGKMRRDPLWDSREYSPEFPQYINEVADKTKVTA